MQTDIWDVSRIRLDELNPQRQAPVDAVTGSLNEFG